MNYRHAFHAGNHADVLKHLVLSRLLALLAKKDAPYAYLDSHAGIGLYDLRGDQASRTGEWLEGIQRVWQADDVPALFDDYLGVIRALNPDGQLRYYPGSPEVARELSREQDRLQLNEKHPEDGQLLKANMKYDRRVAVHLGEGWHVPRALLPTAQKRAVLLIDPPFEQADELQRCVEALNEAHGRMRQAIVAVEDARFLDHPGIDLRGTMCAIVANSTQSGGTQGGSTITQQVAKNMLLTKDQNIERKAKEAIVAQPVTMLTKSWW